MELRPYQKECIDAVEAFWADNPHLNAGVSLPTGAGKTVIMSAMAKRAVDRGERVVIIVHRHELVGQTVAKLEGIDPMMFVGVVKAQRNEVAADVVVASLQTLSRPGRAEKLGRRELVIYDEAHGSASDSAIDVMTRLGAIGGDAKAVGFSATFYRADRRPLDVVWDDIVYERDILWAVREGYLSDATGLSVPIEGLDLSKVKESGGDYQDRDLGQAMMDAHAAGQVAKAYREHAAERKAICFAPTVAAAEAISAELNSLGISSETVTGKTNATDRKAMYTRLRAGATRVLCSVAVLTEGFDEPSVDCVIMARPTKSQGLYVQCLDDQTEILTPSGWAGRGEVAEGDMVAGFDTATGAVRWVPAVSTVERPLGEGEEMYGISSPALDIRVTGGHRMVFGARRGDTSWRVELAEDLAQRKSDYRVPIAGVQDAPGAPLTDDEIRFLGWFMTDGTISPSVGQVTIFQAEHQPMNEDIVSMLQGCGFKYSVYRSEHSTQFKRNSATLRYAVSKGQPRGRDKHLRGWGDLEDWLMKVPGEIYESLSRRQFAVLLEAIHLGDGAKQRGQTWTRRSYHVTSGRKDFCDRLQSLAVRRGFKCNVAEQSKPTGGTAWVLHIKDKAWAQVGGASQGDRDHLARVDSTPGEMVWCVENELGTLITRRGGKVTVLGNCVGRGLRLFPGKKDCLILDVSGSSDDNSLIALPDLAGVEKKSPDESLVQMAARPEAAERAPMGMRANLRKGGAFDPFARRSLVWLETHGGRRFVATERDTYVFLHGDDGEGYRVGEIKKRSPHGKRDGKWLVADPVPEEFALPLAEQFAEEIGARSTKAKYRAMTHPASVAQIGFASSLGVKGAYGMSTAEVSKAIDVALASAVID